MASSSMRQRRYLAPPSSSDGDSSAPHLDVVDEKRKKRKRDANVYDAVAGRVTTKYALGEGSDSETFHQRRHRSTLRDPTLAPDEVLFQRAGAPIRYAEKDIYNAHERLPDSGRGVLPDSDMLKAIHRYSSRFYSALAESESLGGKGGREAQRNLDERSMDETALLAFGILLEEAGRDALGNRGDLVFTEGTDAHREGQPGSTLGQAVSFLDVDVASSGPKRGVGPGTMKSD